MNKRFSKELNSMLRDEHQAPRDYSKLIRDAPNKTTKVKIRRIQAQERNHYRILGGIKKHAKLR
jgi:rubrerythrin